MADLYDLFEPKALRKAKKEAEAKARDWSSGDIEFLRRRCKNDLFFLCAGPLEYTRLSPTFHGDLTGWIQRQWGAQYRLLLLARGHYKTTVETIGDSIQMALPNVSESPHHPYCLGTNVKILIAHEVRETAADFLYEITAAFTKKPMLMALFPECVPRRNVERLNKWQLELPRTEHPKEATFSTIGSGGAAQGGHYNWLKLDDLVGEKARDSETIMGRTLTWFDNINSLLTELEVDGWTLTGTRWAYSDVYSHAMERYGLDVENSVTNCLSPKDIERNAQGLLRVYARGAIERGKPVFSEQFSLEKLRVLRKNKLVWAAQYANNPMESGLQEFVWPLKFYNVDSGGNIKVHTGDSSFKRYKSDLDICVFTDPSMGETKTADETGIVVTGTDRRSNIFILETVKKRLRPPEYIDELYRLNFKYRPRVMTIEEVNFSGIYKYWLDDKSKETRVHLPIRPYKPGNQRTKDGRIRGLAHLFASGQVYCFEGMHDFRDEYEQFPMGKGKHLLDALAQGPEFWQDGVSESDIEHQMEVANEVINSRSILTGY